MDGVDNDVTVMVRLEPSSFQRFRTKGGVKVPWGQGALGAQETNFATTEGRQRHKDVSRSGPADHESSQGRDASIEAKSRGKYRHFARRKKKSSISLQTELADQRFPGGGGDYCSLSIADWKSDLSTLCRFGMLWVDGR